MLAHKQTTQQFKLLVLTPAFTYVLTIKYLIILLHQTSSNPRISPNVVYSLSPFSTRRIFSRDAKRKTNLGNVIGQRKNLPRKVGSVPTFLLFARTNSPSGERALDLIELDTDLGLGKT
jgi:hypothetical protein